MEKFQDEQVREKREGKGLSHRKIKEQTLRDKAVVSGVSWKIENNSRMVIGHKIQQLQNIYLSGLVIWCLCWCIHPPTYVQINCACCIDITSIFSHCIFI